MTTDTKAAPVAPESAPKLTEVPAERKRFTIDQRYIAPILVTSILIAGNFGFGVLESLPKTLLAVVAAIVTEVALGKLVTGKVPHLASAYITGISVGILIRSPFWWPYALCSMISITCKYVIRVKGRHIWNPSNFGIAMMLLIAADSVATLSIQWGNNIYPMAVIWALGSFIIYRLKRFHICLTYIASFVFFSFIRALVTGHDFLAELAPITGPMYQLYIFFMITDPKTTVLTKKGQILTAFAVAAVEAALRLTGSFFAIHAPYYALFLVGPTANLIEIYRNSRNPIAAPAANRS